MINLEIEITRNPKRILAILNIADRTGTVSGISYSSVFKSKNSFLFLNEGIRPYNGYYIHGKVCRIDSENESKTYWVSIRLELINGSLKSISDMKSLVELLNTYLESTEHKNIRSLKKDIKSSIELLEF